MQYPNDWLKKHLDIEAIAVSVTAQQPVSDGESPLVRTRALRLAVLAPVFAVLADRAVAGQTTAVIDIILEPVIVSVSSQQVTWLKTFAQMLPTVLAAKGDNPHHIYLGMQSFCLRLAHSHATTFTVSFLRATAVKLPVFQGTYNTLGSLLAVNMPVACEHL